ncbi:hypothetical protein MCC01989_08850 [Bifidobacteriaceae bacterium MCC01989]|nr:hypothetical protein MCC01989_08850 [Bifidobacteriaceae bacterium MCC01989]
MKIQLSGLAAMTPYNRTIHNATGELAGNCMGVLGRTEPVNHRDASITLR